MPFDGLVLAAVRRELEEKLAGGRIERIYQPDKNELILVVHRPGGRHRLLLSADARHARVHLTATARENPTTPPLFCMVLRKHLEGGRVLGFEQPGLERVLVIKIESRDELGRPGEKQLICEIMGKHSNIILVEPAPDTVIDGIRRYSHAVSRYREVLPGRPYLPPPAQGKLNPLLADEEEFRQACLESPLETALPDLLQRRFEGFSTVTCREIVYRAGLPPDTPLDQCGDYDLRVLWQALRRVTEQAGRGRFEPCLAVSQKGEPVDFAALDLAHTGYRREHGEMNSLLDAFFADRERKETLNREKTSLASVVNKETARLEKKLGLYAESLAETAGAEKMRLYGELLTANLYRLEKGSPGVTLENFYEEGCPPVTVPLNPQLTPLENARAFFKKYVKAKNTREALESRIALAREELDYLEGVRTALDLASDPAGLAEIRQELLEQGYLKQPAHAAGARKGKKEKQVLRPLSLVSTDGFEIFVGKNNKQNDYLTLKMARENDIWLHAKDMPGAHVIIRTEGREVPPATLAEAAALAAFFSRGRGSKNVPVDYTLKKHVRKPGGARPGMVVYERQRTIMAAPGEELAERLKGGGKGQGEFQ
ncbi:MAG: NFACT family protein [Peptococcaceae bacterium]|nr:NFACT family protein [Peptococcaceae bacterium]